MNVQKRWINIFFPIAGIIIVLLYLTCEDSCAYLEGTIMGLSLQYLGIIYMGILLVSHILKKLYISLFLLSSGLGAEVQLLAFQIQNDVYCSYCLAFGAVILVLFILNFEKSKKIFISGSLVLGLILFSIFFKGSATPAYAADIVVPSFGCGKIQVRLYTDYFCNPCRALEPSIEPLIIDLVEKEKITITFIDTPIHKQTTLYAKYFLYVLNEDSDFKHALHARSVLFEAAKDKIKEKGKLEEFIKKKGLSYKPFDPGVTLKIFSESLKKDKITATPTCVIYNDGKKEEFKGRDIKRALEKLK